MRKKISVLFVCILIALSIPNANVNAASKETKAKTAYSNWLKGQSNTAYFTLADLDADKVPELLYTNSSGSSNTFNSNNGESVFVYTYQNGEVVKAGELTTISTHSIYYSKKLKKYVSKYTYGDTVVGYQTITLNSNKEVEIKNDYSVFYQISQCTYSKDEVEISQKDYYKYVNSKYYIYDGAKFNSADFKTLKSYKNNSTNRKDMVNN